MSNVVRTIKSWVALVKPLIISEVQRAAKAVAAFLAPIVAIQIGHLLRKSTGVAITPDAALVQQLILGAFSSAWVYFKRNGYPFLHKFWK